VAVKGLKRRCGVALVMAACALLRAEGLHLGEGGTVCGCASCLSGSGPVAVTLPYKQLPCWRRRAVCTGSSVGAF